MSKLSKAQLDFVDKLLKSFEKGQIPWRPTWDQNISVAYNAKSKKPYTGINQLNLFITSLNSNFEDPRWMTFKQANEVGYRIMKGAVGTNIFYFAFRNMKTNEVISREDYDKLEAEKQKDIAIVSKSYKVYNAVQINGIPPIDIKKESVHFENEKAALFAETLKQNMQIDILHQGDRAFYNPAKDQIILPPSDSFMDEQSYYAVRLHESAHATMHFSRLDRDAHGSQGSEKYAIEELRAELTAAFMTLDIGFHFDAQHEENHMAYIQSWKKILHEQPRVIFSAISDAQKIREYMLDKGEYGKIYNEQEQSKDIVLFHGSPKNSSDKRNTVVINLFAGPGAGKTTCSWEIASELKKMGYVTEYVPEYAKELVWDDKRELLDGTLEHQQMLLNEQEHRVERLAGKVDFIVTDAPSLLNLNFLKCEDQEQAAQYKENVLNTFRQHNNFNLFIKRGDTYETVGRVHTLEESIALDESIKELLEENHLYYGSYDHESIEQVLKNCVTTFNRINDENEKKEQAKKVNLDDMKNSVSIAEYAQTVLGMGLIKESKGIFRLDEHDSCKIYPNNTFYRFSTGVGGSIIDFIKHFESCDTKEAIHKMSDYYQEFQPEKSFDSKSKTTNSQGRFSTNVEGIEVPEKATTNKHIFAYLTKTRGIKPSIVNEYIDNKILYEDVHHNCVFLGKYNKNVYYASLRGTGKQAFKQDAAGSIKEVGVYVDNHSETLVVNEAVIDQMSYMSMIEKPEEFNYLSVCSATNTVNAIRFHMSKREEAANIKRIIIGLDNDDAGEANAKKAIDFIKEEYPNIETLIHIPDAKDFNEQLQNELDIVAQTAPMNDEALATT